MKVIIPIECEEGHQYALRFEDCKDLPIEIDIEVIDVSLKLISEKPVNNGMKSISLISNSILNFLIDNDVILYFYCSHKDGLNYRGTRDISPQEYRSRIFKSMFDKYILNNPDSDYVHRRIILVDHDNANHYLHLISRKKNLPVMEKIADELINLGNK